MIRAINDQPNVLLISIHDLNTHLGCFGNPVVQSPNLDRLAGRGRLFQNHVCNYPLCGPSRASLLTGRRPDSTGVLDNLAWFRDTLPNAVTLPAHFKAHGYFTARQGTVFHGGMDDEAAWDVGGNFIGRRQARTPEEEKDREARHDRFEPAADAGAHDVQAADWAVEMLEQHHRRRFFITAGFSKPHVPLTAPQRFFDPYDPADIELPPTDEAVEARLPKPATRPNFDIFIRRKPRDKAEARQAKLAYYACISFVDEQVGKLLDAMDRLGLWENTVVALFSDHGFHLGEHGMWSKNTLFAASTQAPFMVAFPGIEDPGRPTRRLSEHVDIYPTLVDLCGLPFPEGLEGTSLKPLLHDPARPWKRAVFSQIRRGDTMGRLMRTEQWHYVHWEATGEEELYATETDPCQMNNMAAGQPEVITEMRGILAAGWKDSRPIA